MVFNPRSTIWHVTTTNVYAEPTPCQIGFSNQPQTAPPPSAAKLLEDMEQIMQKFEKIDKTEKTVNLINSKVNDLEAKMQNLETRL